MKASRVLHLRASPFFGGPERQIIGYAGSKFSAPTQSCVGTFLEGTEGAEFLGKISAAGLEKVILPGGGARALTSLVAAVRQKRISLICTHGYKADILGILAGRMTGIPVASFLRGWTGEDCKVRLYEFANKALLNFTDCIVCLSQTQAAQISRMVAIKKEVHVVVNAIQTQFPSGAEIEAARHSLRTRYSLQREQKIIVAAGRLSPEKGTIFFVEAGKKVVASHPDAVFIIFGEGKERPRLQAAAALERRIIFAGHVPNLSDLLKGVDIVVNPSLREEMPNIVLEALSSGLPLIATAVGALPEIAGSEESMLLVPPGDAGAIASSIERLLVDTDLGRAVGSRGRKRIQEGFSPKRQLEQLEHLYSRLIPGYLQDKTSEHTVSAAY